MKYFIVTTKSKLGSTKVVNPKNFKHLMSISNVQGMFYFHDEEDNNKWKRLHLVPDSKYEEAKSYIGDSSAVTEITEQEAIDLSEKHQGG